MILAERDCPSLFWELTKEHKWEMHVYIIDFSSDRSQGPECGALSDPEGQQGKQRQK